MKPVDRTSLLRRRTLLGLVPLTAPWQDVVAFPIARDGVEVAVHRDNPVSELSEDQLPAVYSGCITGCWRVGGHAGTTVVLAALQAASSVPYLG